MKRFTKVLMSLCLLLVVTFTFTACLNDDGSGNGNKFVPPSGVDMTSAVSYASWLDNNLDETLSYTALFTQTNTDGVTTTNTVKYQYKHGLQMIAIYVGTNMSAYMEIYKDGQDFETTIYDVSSQKYYSDTLTSDEFYGKNSSSVFGEALLVDDDPNDNLAPAAPLSLVKMKLSLMYLNMTVSYLSANTYLNIMEWCEVANSTKTISNPADGKYELKDTGTSNGGAINITFTYENNIVKSSNFSGNNQSWTTNYTYENVVITFDKTGYTLLTKD